MMRTLLAFLTVASLSVPAAILADPIQITTDSARDLHPSWSADGAWIVFESNRSGTWHLYRARVSDGLTEQLTFDGDQLHAEVSPDGSEIVYLDGDATLSSPRLEVMPYSGGAGTTLLDDGSSLWAPTWSPDGQTIYVSRKPGTNWDIVSVPVSGGTWSLVTSVASTDIMGDVASNGNDFVFYSNIGGSAFNVVASTLSSPSVHVQLTFDDNNTSQPTYSPDGTKVAFASRRVGGRLELFEMDLATQSTRRLTFDAEDSPYDPVSQLPQYSPDGTWLAFSSRRLYNNDNIWILPMTGEPPLGNVLKVGDGRGLPGPAVRVPVSLASAVSGAALEFQIHDVPDLLDVTGVEVRGRAATMTASFSANSGVHVLLYGPGGQKIPPGTGAILDLLVEVKESAEVGDSASLDLSDVVLADPAGNPVDLELESGTFFVARLPGDLNGDNMTDVGDLVRLVEIILGTGEAPTAEELEAADCNGDANVNALDVVCLVNTILSAPASAAPTIAAASPATDLVIRVEEDVRGLQLAGAGVPENADLAPFSVHRSEDGTLTLAFDARGGAWTEGASVTVPVTQVPSDVRAYGPGGRRLAVEISGNTVTIGKPLPAGLRAIPATPNPFRGAAQIRFSVDVPARIGITIFDLQGRKVSEIEPEDYPAGRHVVDWSARDLAGRSLPSGLYFARVSGAGQHVSVRLMNLGG